MAKGHIKEVFPGGNTSKGFVSFYEYLAYPNPTKIFVMKGGPGVGKSTFMKAIGAELSDKGFDVELHHCSSDNGSLDGVYVPSIGVALLDGTAPHVVDPKFPGAVDEIVLLGDYWNEPLLRSNVEGIVWGFTENARLFRCAYSCLAAAKVHADEVESYYRDMKALDISGLNQKARDLVADIFGFLTAGTPGPDRHLFGSAITPDGPLNYLDTLAPGAMRRYIIKGDMGTGKSTIVKKLYDEAVSRNFRVEAYHCALTSERLEHLWIPELETLVLTGSEAHSIDVTEGDTIVDTSEFTDMDKMDRVLKDMEDARVLYLGAMDRGVSFISRAKANHDKLETYYIPAMEFDKVARRKAEVMDRILSLVG